MNERYTMNAQTIVSLALLHIVIIGFAVCVIAIDVMDRIKGK